MVDPLIFTPESRDHVLAHIVHRFCKLPKHPRLKMVLAISKKLRRKFRYCWTLKARPDQLPPDQNWLIWLLLGGRGSGKTRAGAEWIRERVKKGARRIALIAASYNEAREVMIEGESGLLNIGPPEERPVYYSSRRRLEWPSGAVGQIFSGEDPDGLRGPQFDTGWADEYCAWRYPLKTLANLRLGLRLTSAAGPPRLTVTTTPRPTKALREMMDTSGVVVSRARTLDNAAHLAPAFLSAVTDTYGGTRLGRQELDGQILTDHPGALWTRAMIERACFNPRSDYIRADYASVIVAVDPPASAGEGADACGIIVAGRRLCPPSHPSKAVILFDGTLQGRSPEGWAARTAELFEHYKADYVVAEANQGGDMVRTVLHAAAAHMPVRLVHASKSKTGRAVPVALTYEQGRVSHAARFPGLEDELCQMGADESQAKSPDRADALVWAVTDLLLTRRPEPRVWTAG